MSEQRGRLGVFTIVILLGVGFVAGRISQDSSQGVDEFGFGALANSISVRGTGRVTGKPDLLTVRFSVAGGGEPAGALQQANERTVLLIDALKSQGVAEKDIRTDAVFFTEDFQGFAEDFEGSFPGPNGPIPPGAPPATTSGVEVRIRDIGKALPTIQGALGIEGVSLQSVALSIDGQGKLAVEAKRLAIQQAHKEAEQLARASGRKLGKALSINHDSAFSYEEDHGNSSDQGLPLDDRQREFEMQVSVLYQLK